jgi:hypothetical protein
MLLLHLMNQGARLDDVFMVDSGFLLMSGGQTGADRAGLDWAIAHGIPHGGWCPQGRRSEDGPIAARYRLAETPSRSYLQRTEWNVRDSDAALVFTLEFVLDGGSKRTAVFADKHGKPWLHVHPGIAPSSVVHFLSRNRVTKLNIAGKRESSAPGTGRFTAEMLRAALWPVCRISDITPPGQCKEKSAKP